MPQVPTDDLAWLQPGDRIYHKLIIGRMGHYISDGLTSDVANVQWDHDIGYTTVLKSKIGALPEHNRSHVGPLYLRSREWVRDKHIDSRIGLVLECDDTRKAAYVEWRGEGICRWRSYDGLRRLDHDDEQA